MSTPRHAPLTALALGLALVALAATGTATAGARPVEALVLPCYAAPGLFERFPDLAPRSAALWFYEELVRQVRRSGLHPVTLAEESARKLAEERWPHRLPPPGPESFRVPKASAADVALQCLLLRPGPRGGGGVGRARLTIRLELLDLRSDRVVPAIVTAQASTSRATGPLEATPTASSLRRALSEGLATALRRWRGEGPSATTSTAP